MYEIFQIPEVVATWTNKHGDTVVGVIKEFPDTGKKIFTALALPAREFAIQTVGEIFAPPPGLQNGARTDKWRPAPGGVSIGHQSITAGTLGVLVEDEEGPIQILSNNHVLADSNRGSPGDYIHQPGRYDQPGGGNGGNGNGGSDCPIARAYVWPGNVAAKWLGAKTRNKPIIPTQEDYLIARLSYFIPIEWQEDNGGESLAVANTVDCALAEPLTPDLVIPDILEIGIINGDIPAYLGQTVRKSGRTTELTTGTVQGIDGTVQVNYGSGRIALFKNQILTDAMLQGGDSGSLLVDAETNKATGLSFAGSDRLAIHNPIGDVKRLLGFTWPQWG